MVAISRTLFVFALFVFVLLIFVNVIIGCRYRSTFDTTASSRILHLSSNTILSRAALMVNVNFTTASSHTFLDSTIWLNPPRHTPKVQLDSINVNNSFDKVPRGLILRTPITDSTFVFIFKENSPLITGDILFFQDGYVCKMRSSWFLYSTLCTRTLLCLSYLFILPSAPQGS